MQMKEVVEIDGQKVLRPIPASLVVDASLSSTSSNPVQNKVVTDAINNSVKSVKWHNDYRMVSVKDNANNYQSQVISTYGDNASASGMTNQAIVEMHVDHTNSKLVITYIIDGAKFTKYVNLT